MFDIQEYIKNTSLIICVKNIEGGVLYQNDACLQLCGNMLESQDPCKKNCMTRYVYDKSCPKREEGTQFYPSQIVEGEYYDIVFINDQKSLVSLLYPLNHKYEIEIKYFSQFNLTKREIDIVSLVVRNYVNKDITEKLNLKKGTLKTHLNNIYKKLPKDACAKLRSSYNSN